MPIYPGGNPASGTANVEKLAALVRQQAAELAALQVAFAARTPMRRGEVTAYAGGTQMSVLLEGSTDSIICRFIGGWAPGSVGLKVFVLFGPEGIVAIGPDSIQT